MVADDNQWRLPPVQRHFTVTAKQLGQVVPWGINRLAAIEARQYTSGKGALVAVIDTGIDTQHPDFAGAIHASSKDFTGSKYGLEDRDGHGTHTAGTIGARNNDQGVDSMAPECQILALKALGDNGWGESSWIAAAIRYAADVGAHVLNMSLGSPSPSAQIRTACEYAVNKGCLIVCAAGNEGPGQNTVGYPGAWDDVASAIAAMDEKDRIASFSSRGKQVDCCAPGVSVVSCAPGNKYAYMSGTSMATPHVAGGLALVVAYRKAKGLKALTHAQMLQGLEKTSTHLQPKVQAGSPDFGHGVYNTEGMIHYAAETPPGPVPPPTPGEPSKDQVASVFCFLRKLGEVLRNEDLLTEMEKRARNP